MKLLISITTFSILMISGSAFAGNAAKVSVNGLVCDFCARALEKTFGDEESVSGIDVNLDTKIVTVMFEEGGNLDDERITYLITDSGYNVESIDRTQESDDLDE